MAKTKTEKKETSKETCPSDYSARDSPAQKRESKAQKKKPKKKTATNFLLTVYRMIEVK